MSQIQLEFGWQGKWISGAYKAIESTRFCCKGIEQHETIFGYVMKNVPLVNCGMLFLLAIESIQGNTTEMRVYYAGQYIKTHIS